MLGTQGSKTRRAPEPRALKGNTIYLLTTGLQHPTATTYRVLSLQTVLTLAQESSYYCILLLIPEVPDNIIMCLSSTLGW